MSKPALIRTPGAVLYTRVSTNEQVKHGTSLAGQMDACRQKALALSLPIVAEYEDAGISGGEFLTRDGIQAALADVEAGRADTIICYELSRISRVVKDQQEIKARVEAVGGRLVFCNMDFDDTDEGDMMFGMMGTYAQYERKVIRTRTMKGKRRRAGEGQQPARSTPPYGYHIVTKADVIRGDFPAAQVGRYFVDEDKAPLVRQLFTRYAAGESTPALCRELNARGIPAARGGAWRPTCLLIILKNPAYKGEPSYGRFLHQTRKALPHERHSLTGEPLTSRITRRAGEPIALTAPPLVTEDLWNRVQERIATNPNGKGGNPKRARMLSGRVFCPDCGSRLVLVGRNATKFYQCGRTHESVGLFGKHVCTQACYPVQNKEADVVLAFLNAAAGPKALADAVRVYQGRQHGASEDADALRMERDALDKALAAIKQQEAAAVQAQVAGIMAGASPDAYGALFADLAARRKDAEDQRGRVTRRIAQTGKGVTNAVPSISDAHRQALADAALVLTSPNVEGAVKRDIVGGVVSKVVCREEATEVFFLPGMGAVDGTYSVGADTCSLMETELMQ